MYQVRNGQQVVPTCPECGCRLGQFENMWYHFFKKGFPLFDTRDARGCKCSLYRRAIEVVDPNGRFDNGNIVVV